MFITFFVSSIAHELVMSCITKKLRGYGFLMMMMQLPIVAVQRSKLIRNQTTLNVSDEVAAVEHSPFDRL
jgi:sterol O-acyltransferase